MINLVMANLMYFIIIEFAGKKIFGKKQSIGQEILVVFGTTIAISIFNGYGPNHYGAVVFFLLILFLSLFQFRTTFIDGILYSILQVINIVLSEFISMFILKIDDSIEILSSKYHFGLMLSVGISFILSFAIIWIFDKKKKYEDSPYLCMIFVLPLATLLLIMNIKDYFMLVNNYPRVFIVIVGLCLSNIITLIFFFKFLELIKLEHQLKEEQIKSQTHKEHIKLLDEQYKNNFDYLHELLHKIYNISGNIKDFDTKCKLEELSKNIDFHFNSILTNSLSLNVAINKMVSELETNGIVLRTTVYDALSNLDFENQVDFFILMLRAGINSCCKSDIQERILIIQIQKKKNMEIVRFVMPNVENDLYKDLEQFLTSKGLEFDIFECVDDNMISFMITSNVDLQ
ncbi:MAG: hypothetical protein Q4C49_13485 [Bacillota bacterium]|nr:hypothetical protein [Bacillota bacterium]